MKKYYLAIAFAVGVFLPGVNLHGQNQPAVEMRVKNVIVDPFSDAPVVILESIQDKRLLPIWVGGTEAASIAMQLERIDSPRPNTHDLIRNILQGLGATLHRTVITDLRNNTYYAVLTLKLKDQEFQIDSRPSDAIAIALRTKAAIFATSQVLAKARPMPAPPAEKEPLRESLGIHLQELTPQIAALLEIQGTRGVLVADVELGSPGLNAGLRRGDVLLKVNEKPVRKPDEVGSLLKAEKSHGPLKLEVLRKGKPIIIAVPVP